MFLQRKLRVAFFLTVVGIQSLAAQNLHATTDSRYGLPGVYRVPFVATAPPRATLALDAAYGYTESQHSEGAHHRLIGGLGLGWVPLSGLEFGAYGRIRYDRHPDEGRGADHGTLGDLALQTRWGIALGNATRLGLDISTYFPGAESPIDSLKNPAFDARTLWGWIPASGPRLAAYSGFRFDTTAGVGHLASRYSSGDRLALGLSDFNAVLLGFGVAVPIGESELLGETSCDLLVGNGAPSADISPIRLDLGARKPISNNLQGEVIGEFSLSSRPVIEHDSKLIPVEPRFIIGFGVRYRTWSAQPTGNQPRVSARTSDMSTVKERVPAEPEKTPTEAATPALSEPELGVQLVVTVLDSNRRPLSDAVVELRTENGVRRFEFRDGSTFVLENATKGLGHLTVNADLMREWSKDIDLSLENPTTVQVEMLMADNAGQIRGTVRAFDGKLLAAQIHVEPGQGEVTARPDGTFTLDVVPGTYRVRVALDGYASQVREVRVGKNGVVVLNVDLKKGP